MKISGFVLLALFICSNVLKAQNNNEKDIITYSNGDEERGIVDLAELNSEGIIYFSNGTKPKKIIYPIQIRRITLSNDRVIIGKSITYLNEEAEYIEDNYFVELVVQGSASLFKVFGTSFDYALESVNGVEALQITKNGDVINESYKGVFYLAFERCRAGMGTTRIGFTLTDFIKALNKYNSCIDPSYKADIKVKVKETLLEVEPRLGVNISSLKIIVDDNSSYEPEELDLNNSISISTSLVIRYGLIKDRIWIVSDVGFTRYKWDVSSESQKTFSSPIEHNEAHLSLGIEGRYSLNEFDIFASTGAQINITLFDQSKNRTVNLNYNDPNFPIKSTRLYPSAARKPEYFTYFLDLGLVKDIKENLAVGLSAKANFGAEEVFTQQNDRHYDEFNYNISISLFARYKLKFLR